MTSSTVLFTSVLFALALNSLVLSDLLCKDSVIDSITYANDQQMYFLTSGGFYWYLKESEFPPPDSKAKRLPEPFKIGQAAVYVDGDSGCASSLTAEGVTAKEKEVWITESIGGMNKLQAFDVKTFQWRKTAIDYNKDHCISRAKITWSNGKPVDAMFARNYLEIFFIQDGKYAMVDCNFICTNPSGWGAEKRPYDTSDFNTVDPIHAMFIKANKELFMFHQKIYYQLTIQGVNPEGKIITVKGTAEKNIMKDFLKIDTPGDCKPPAQAPPVGPQASEEPEAKPDANPEDPGTFEAGGGDGEGEPEGNGNNDENSGMLWLIIGLVVLGVIVAIALCVCLMMRKKKPQGLEAGKSRVSSKMGGSRVGSKVGGSQVSPSKAAPSTFNSSMSVRSKQVAPSGMKSTVVKSKAVKSSVSKK